MTPTHIEPCPLCDTEAQSVPLAADATRFNCAVCGVYAASGTVLERLANGDLADQRWRLSVIARRASDVGRPVFLRSDGLEYLLKDAPRPRGPMEAVDEILLRVADSTPLYGAPCRIPATEYAHHQLQDREALRGVVQFIRDLGWASLGASDGSQHHITLSVVGWQKVAELARNRGNGLRVFVAMAFDKQLDEVFDNAFRPSIEEDCGLQATRVDRQNYNGKIDDHIIAEIRRSRFLVADFTLDRGGVYFEAGFALGLGIDVIYTCRASDIGHLHFDTRQYNHIVWETPAELRGRLTDRIRATIADLPKV